MVLPVAHYSSCWPERCRGQGWPPARPGSSRIVARRPAVKVMDRVISETGSELSCAVTTIPEHSQPSLKFSKIIQIKLSIVIEKCEFNFRGYLRNTVMYRELPRARARQSDNNQLTPVRCEGWEWFCSVLIVFSLEQPCPPQNSDINTFYLYPAQPRGVRIPSCRD